MALSAPVILMVVQTAVIAVFVHKYFFPEKDITDTPLGGGETGTTTADLNDTYDYIIGEYCHYVITEDVTVVTLTI